MAKKPATKTKSTGPMRKQKDGTTDRDGHSIPIWADKVGAKLELDTELTCNVSTDVCIVGAGIAGLTTAYLLAREGRSVIVVDDGPIGGGETGRTTAHLTTAIDRRYSQIELLHGQDGARLTAESHTAAIARIERIVADEGIACDFERLDGYLFAPAGEPADSLDQEWAAARRAGLSQVTRMKQTPLVEFKTGPCLLFPEQAQLHPLKYLAGLAKALRKTGGRIFINTQVKTITGGAAGSVETIKGQVVTAKAVVVATNTPTNDFIAMHTKQAAYRTYVIGARVPHGRVPKALFWDTLNPYHYVRVAASPDGSDLLLVGGEDHKTGQGDDQANPYDRLEAWTRERFSMIEHIESRWSGQVMESIDGLAYIGRNPLDEANVFIVTGDCGMGMTHGTIAGLLLTDLIVDRPNPWASLYDPTRVTVGAVADFARENVNVAAQFTAWVTGGDLDSADDLEPGMGAVLRRGVGKVAVYRDKSGLLHERSAVCPHMGCIVGWNNAERTWDCPCHGSRFDTEGRVLNGPANSGLVPVSESPLVG